MPSSTESKPGAMSLAHIHQTGLDAIELICGSISRPLELILRPWHGTRYFALPVVAISTVIMILIPALLLVVDGIISMIPFSHPQPSVGMFSIGSFAELFFLLSAIHAYRLYKRMIHMSSEEHSTFEGPPLPFFPLIPWCRSFHFTRIVAEPLLVLLASIVLQDLFLIQTNLAIYLRVAALALALKSFVAWYRAWEYVRDVLDAKNAGPILAKLAEDRASDDDLASINLAFPKDVAPEIRAEAIVSIARAYSSTH